MCFCYPCFATLLPSYPYPLPPTFSVNNYLLNGVVCWYCVDSCQGLGSRVWHDGNGESLTTEEITTLLLFPHLPSNITDYNPG